MNLVAHAGQPHKEVSLVRFDIESPMVSALRCPVAPIEKSCNCPNEIKCGTWAVCFLSCTWHF